MKEIELDRLLCLYADTHDVKHLERMKEVINEIISSDLSNNIVTVEG